MQPQHNQQKRNRARRFTVSGKYENARFYDPDNPDIEAGDTCIVKPGAPYKDGDLVLIECECRISESLHYHAKVFNRLHGHKYSFCLSVYGKDGKRCLPSDEKIIVGPIIKVIRKGEAKRPQKGQARRSTHLAGFDWTYFGVHKGDDLIVEESGLAPVGRLVLMRGDDGEKYFARVCSVKDDTVRTCGDNSSMSESSDESLNNVVGPVVEIKHENCAQPRLTELRERLARLQEDDDHTLNITKIFEVEKEIFDLEHPPEEVDEEEEWPDVISEEGEQ